MNIEQRNTALVSKSEAGERHRDCYEKSPDGIDIGVFKLKSSYRNGN